MTIAEHGLIYEERLKFHRSLLNSILTIDSNGVVSNADVDNKTSSKIAKGIFDKILAATGFPPVPQPKKSAQTAGKEFEGKVTEFIKSTFPKLQDLRPGDWKVERLGNRNSIKASSFSQYNHLQQLNKLIAGNSTLATALGKDYIIAPDIIISRGLCSDDEINNNSLKTKLVDEESSLYSDLREKSFDSKIAKKRIMHASISVKWTMRSDRAQNSRTEALNLIRNRKGRLPHIMIVTAEPAPSRLASLALGTGDIDCVYHFALMEFLDYIDSDNTLSDDLKDLLHMLVDGKRVKDISDLPLDLCV